MKKIFNLVAALMLLATTAHAQSTWLGNTNNLWTTGTNWSGGVPGPTTDVIIPNGKAIYPTLNTNTGSCRTLTIQSGASNPSLTIPLNRTLTVNASTGTVVSNAGTLTIGGTLVVKGNVANNGTITSTTGTVRFTNSATVDITGTGTTSLYDVTFAGTGLTRFGVASTLTNPVRIARRALLQVSPSTATGGDVQANGKVRFVSSAVGGTPATTPCGYVFLGGGGGKLTGVITVERAISSVYNKGLGYRHYSTPVNAPALTTLATTGYAPDLDSPYQYPRDIKLTPPNIHYYNESLVPNTPAAGADAFSYGWVFPTSAEVMETGKGYTLRIDPAAKVTLTGTANTGSYATAPLTRTNNNATAAGCNFVGNPYPTPIDVFKVMTDNLFDDDTTHIGSTYNPNGFDGTVYFFRSFSTYTGSYQTINVTGAGSSDSLTQLFPVMQGFFVRKTVTPANAIYAAQAYQFNDAQRADPLDASQYPSGVLTPFYRSASPAAATAPWLFRLAVTDTKTKATDNTTVGFRADATPGFDYRYDAIRPGDNLGMPTTCTLNAANEPCIMNFLPMPTTTLTVPVGLKTLVPGRTYTLAAPAKQQVPANTRVWLEDRAGGKAIELTAGRAVTFTAGATEYAHRFFLRFEPAGAAVAPAAAALEVAVYPNPSTADQTVQLSANKLSGSTATATLINAFGQSVKTVQVPVRGGLLNGEVPTAGLPVGVYLLRISTEAGVTTRRLEIR